MSRFQGTMKGQAKSEATRRGSEKTGMYAHIYGWNIGIKVSLAVDTSGKDIATVTLTSGRQGDKADKLIGYYQEY